MKKAIVETYIDTTLPYPDVCTAAVLCGPAGPRKRKAKARYQIGDNILSQNIAVTSNTLFCSWIIAVLAHKSFLLLPNDLKDCIKSACQDNDLNLNINPMDKIAIEPTGSGAELSFPHKPLLYTC